MTTVPPKVDFTTAPSTSPPTLQSKSSSQQTSPSHVRASVTLVFDPQDPEEFLKRCSGYNKKTGRRCAQGLGKMLSSRKGGETELTYLPTCHAHKDQLCFAGRCVYTNRMGVQCGTLFRWNKPYLQLCSEHVGCSTIPCYLLKLPLELRHEIFRYLLPDAQTGVTSSSTLPIHNEANLPPIPASAVSGAYNGSPPIGFPPSFSKPNTRAGHQRSLCNVLCVNRQIYEEMKDLLYGSVPFTIDIRKDGAFMCGRRLLEPKTADGVPHCREAGSEETLHKFLKNFDFGAVKNYDIHILLENGSWGDYHLPPRIPSQPPTWDEEVEIYDIRDYVGVVVSGILSRSHILCRLNVRVGLTNFQWPEELILANVRKLVEPFERLRKVNQPRFCGIYEGTTSTPLAITVQRRLGLNLCSIARLSTHTILLGPGNPRFEEYKRTWEACLASSSAAPGKPAIRTMFSELKTFYSKLHMYLPEIHRMGKHAFLHRARVAREMEDVEAFREVRNELILYWTKYLEQEEAKKEDMYKKLNRMLDVDTYSSPSSELRMPCPVDFAKPGDLAQQQVLGSMQDRLFQHPYLTVSYGNQSLHHHEHQQSHNGQIPVIDLTGMDHSRRKNSVADINGINHDLPRSDSDKNNFGSPVDSEIHERSSPLISDLVAGSDLAVSQSPNIPIFSPTLVQLNKKRKRLIPETDNGTSITPFAKRNQAWIGHDSTKYSGGKQSAHVVEILEE